MISESDGRDIRQYRKHGPQCFQQNSSRNLPAELPKVTFQQEAAYRYTLESRPVHPLFGSTTSKWSLQALPPPAISTHHSRFGGQVITPSLLCDKFASSVNQPAAVAKLPAKTPVKTPFTLPPAATKKTSKKLAQAQEECSHYTDSWWVRINALNDCETCNEEWEFLYECPACFLQTCPPWYVIGEPTLSSSSFFASESCFGSKTPEFSE